jgi:beta-phosphoglucomutase family hydrolase
MKKIKIQAVIFDMDGLMIETEPLHSKSFEAVLRDYGITPEYDEKGFVHTQGLRGKDNLRNLKEKYNIDESVDVLLEKKFIVHTQLLKKVKPKPGLKKLLQLLKKHSIKAAIGSNANPKNINTVLTNLHLKDYFQVTVTGYDFKKGKPDPGVFLITAKKLGVNPENCLVLEDSETGVLAAHRAGMKVVAVPSTYTKDHDFSRADRVVNSLESVTIELISSV